MTIKSGINMAYSTILLDGLESDNVDMKITESEASWIGMCYDKILYLCLESTP